MIGDQADEPSIRPGESAPGPGSGLGSVPAAPGRPTAERREERFRDGPPNLEDFDRLAAVQRARVAASRSALIAQASLGPEQVERVDAALSQMNGQLAGYGEEMLDQMSRRQAPDPAQALSLGHDVSGILLEGQKELDAVVGEAASEVDPAALEIWNYVDIEQWRPAVEQHLEAPAASPQPTAQGTAGTRGE